MRNIANFTLTILFTLSLPLFSQDVTMEDLIRTTWEIGETELDEKKPLNLIDKKINKKDVELFAIENIDVAKGDRYKLSERNSTTTQYFLTKIQTAQGLKNYILEIELDSSQKCIEIECDHQEGSHSYRGEAKQISRFSKIVVYERNARINNNEIKESHTKINSLSKGKLKKALKKLHENPNQLKGEELLLVVAASAVTDSIYEIIEELLEKIKEEERKANIKRA